MSPVRNLTANDFEKQSRGSRLFDRWQVQAPLESPIGPFEIELRQPPNEELLNYVNQLIAFVSTEYDTILNAIYDHYQRAAEDKYWMKSCDVPRRLRDHQVKRYLRGRSIVVARDRNGRVVGTIYISPQWHNEHGIHLGVKNGRLIPQPP